MWIFDDEWWPSQTMGKRVPPEYAAKRLKAEVAEVQSPERYSAGGLSGDTFIAAIAGRKTGGKIDGGSLVDLAPFIKDGSLTWDAPAGLWQVMTFTYEQAPPAAQNHQYTLDGASQDCVDWFIDTVYKPHYDRFKEDFGKTIVGYFYDEPETQGDWGTELPKVVAEKGYDLKKLLVARKFELAGEEQVTAQYAYSDALYEAWGRTMYGSLTKWCEERGVASIGHFMDHGDLYWKPGLGAGNLFQMQKYSSMGGMDLVVRQLYPGQRKHDIYQLPKLTSSISHAYNKADHLAMCEIYGAYGQDLTYPQMKWLIDHHQVRGVNFMISHSFNPRAPHDTDCPPYFYNDGEEPRWPLYRVWADYTSRLSVMLTGGRHVCPVALLAFGNSIHAGRAITPEDMTSSLQDALFDCDWLPYEVFEGDCQIDAAELNLYEERYRVLVVPPVEVIPYATLVKAREFFDAGGVVIGYGFLPALSGAFGRSSLDIQALTQAIWGTPEAGIKACKTNAKGGRSYFLAEKPTPEQIRAVLVDDGGIRPALDVIEGDTGNWLHTLHRVKEGRDVFFVCNQHHEGEARTFTFRANAEGVPECWDALRNEITSISFKRNGDAVEFELTLAPLESVLIVFAPETRSLPARISPHMKPVAAFPVKRSGGARVSAADEGPALSLEGCSWVWYPEGNPAESAPPGKCYFRREMKVENAKRIKNAVMRLTADNRFLLLVNGNRVGRNVAGGESWRTPSDLDFTEFLVEGMNTFAIEAINTTDNPSPAGLLGRILIAFDHGEPIIATVDGSWKVSKDAPRGWERPGFDDSSWKNANEFAAFGAAPWGPLGQVSPILAADPFEGQVKLPKLDKGQRALLVMSEPAEGARVSVNGASAGGMIGGPFRLDITNHARAGENAIGIEPYAPTEVSVAIY